MTLSPGITVVIPAHPARLKNGMLDRALKSVSYQTLPPAAVSIAVDLNGAGAPATRQRALDAVQTEWTAFLDSDDFFFPAHLEKLARHAEETQADMVYSWFKVQDAAGKLLDHDPVFPETHFTEPFDPDNPIETTITTLVKTYLAKQIGFRAMNRGEANTGEDRLFILELLARDAKIEHLVEKTWAWSHHGLNTSGLPTKGDGPLATPKR